MFVGAVLQLSSNRCLVIAHAQFWMKHVIAGGVPGQYYYSKQVGVVQLCGLLYNGV